MKRVEKTSSHPRRSYSNADLLHLTKTIAISACPANPGAVNQRAFNAARKAAGSPECPEASYIVKRLGYSWPEFLKLALTEEGNNFKTLSSHTREWGQPDIGTCAMALRTVAHRLQSSTVRPNEYMQEREAIIRPSRGINRVQLEEQLPTHGQIERHGWDTALQAASLQTRPKVARVQGVPVPDVIERFLMVQGRLPSHTDIIRFAKEQGFALGKNKTILLHVEELRERRSREGLWTPARLPKPTQQPPWRPSAAAQRDKNNPRVRRGYWTPERVKAGLKTAIENLEPGQQLTSQVLMRMAQSSDEIPSASVVGRVAKEHGTTFSEMRTKALSELR